MLIFFIGSDTKQSVDHICNCFYFLTYKCIIIKKSIKYKLFPDLIKVILKDENDWRIMC